MDSETDQDGETDLDTETDTDTDTETETDSGMDTKMKISPPTNQEILNDVLDRRNNRICNLHTRQTICRTIKCGY